MADDLWRIREEYEGVLLDVAACDADPMVELRRWLDAAVTAKLPTPNAMTLATADEHGRPSARIVLLKELDARGLVFYTSYDSRKAGELARNPAAALVLYWEAMHRQVRVEGAVERISPAESDAYFASRPRGSQLGAIASPQSQVIASRDELLQRVDAVDRRFANAPLARPASWGGYRVVPEMIELWQGQPSRLHDRVRYRRDHGAWIKERLAP